MQAQLWTSNEFRLLSDRYITIKAKSGAKSSGRLDFLEIPLDILYFI